MASSEMRDNVERWLVHGGLSFDHMGDTPKNSFCVAVRRADADLEIFEPAGQPNVLVLGAKYMLRNKQNIRYKGLTVREREIFEGRIAEYCRSIRAVHRVLDEDGRMGVGIYVVLDRQDRLNQAGIMAAMDEVVEMCEKVYTYISKTF